MTFRPLGSAKLLPAREAWSWCNVHKEVFSLHKWQALVMAVRLIGKPVSDSSSETFQYGRSADLYMTKPNVNVLNLAMELVLLHLYHCV